MSYEDLISRIAREIPALAGKLSAPRVTYVKSLKKTYITFESAVLVGEKEFLRLERILRETFPGRPLAVRVASPGLRDSFLADVGAYRSVLTDFLRRNYPAMVAWLNQIDWSCEGNRVTLTFPDEFSLQYMGRNNVTNRLATAIREIFDARVTVETTLAGDREARMEQMRQERARSLLTVTRAEMANGTARDIRRRSRRRRRSRSGSPQSGSRPSRRRKSRPGSRKAPWRRGFPFPKCPPRRRGSPSWAGASPIIRWR